MLVWSAGADEVCISVLGAARLRVCAKALVFRWQSSPLLWCSDSASGNSLLLVERTRKILNWLPLHQRSSKMYSNYIYDVSLCLI